MNEQKLRGMLGLAVRARQAQLGTDACRLLVLSGVCGVLLLDAGTSPNTRAKCEEWCRRSDTPVVILPEGMIADATGRTNITLGIRKGSFSEQVLAITGGEQESNQ